MATAFAILVGWLAANAVAILYLTQIRRNPDDDEEQAAFFRERAKRAAGRSDPDA